MTVAFLTLHAAEISAPLVSWNEKAGWHVPRDQHTAETMTNSEVGDGVNEAVQGFVIG